MDTVFEESKDLYQAMIDVASFGAFPRLLEQANEDQLELLDVISQLHTKLMASEKEISSLQDENKDLRQRISVLEKEKEVPTKVRSKSFKIKALRLAKTTKTACKEVVKATIPKETGHYSPATEELKELDENESFERAISATSTPRPSMLRKVQKETLPVNRKPHAFKIFSSLLDTCDICKGKITLKGRAAVKCYDCDMRIHTNCNGHALVTCSPRSACLKVPDKSELQLWDFCSQSAHDLQIPFPLIQCISAVERKGGLTFEGIYRMPGSAKGVARIFDKFLSNRPFPNLTNQPIPNITGCVMKFLRSLKTSVVPAYRLAHFLKAAQSRNQEGLMEAVKALPKENRHTLAFLCLHLHNVATHQDFNRMGLDALGICMALSIVPSLPHKSPHTAAKESVAVMDALLALPKSFWRGILSVSGIRRVSSRVLHLSKITEKSNLIEDE